MLQNKIFGRAIRSHAHDDKFNWEEKKKLFIYFHRSLDLDLLVICPATDQLCGA